LSPHRGICKLELIPGRFDFRLSCTSEFYTYAKVPAGFWLADLLHLKRNHFDRVIHFAFGFLLLYPMRELLRRSAGAHQTWATWLALSALSRVEQFFRNRGSDYCTNRPA
jgi:uncharacterized membrane protein YjdF